MSSQKSVHEKGKGNLNNYMIAAVALNEWQNKIMLLPL